MTTAGQRRDMAFKHAELMPVLLLVVMRYSPGRPPDMINLPHTSMLGFRDTVTLGRTGLEIEGFANYILRRMPPSAGSPWYRWTIYRPPLHDQRTICC